MTSKFSIDNRELLQRISSGEAVVGIDFGNLIVRELAAFRLAAMDSEPAELPLDYLRGHKDGLEWAAKLAEANHPETGDWLYDDPIELAKAIRKGTDMPPVQPVADSEPVAWGRFQETPTDGGYWILYDYKPNCSGVEPLYRHAQPAPEYPEVLPCSVLLEPGLRFGKGIKASTMLAALARRAVHESDMAALSPEERVEFQARIEDFKALIAQPAPVVPDKMTAIVKDEAEYVEGWNACRAAMLQAGTLTNEDTKQAWTGIPDIDNAINMLDRIDTLESCDDDRIEAVKTVLRGLAGNSPAIPDGYVMVPVEPTKEILDEFDSIIDYGAEDSVDAWHRLLAAAPQSPGSEPATVPGEWIPVSEQMPPSRHEVLVGRWWGEKPRWCCKWATYIPCHPDAQSSGWLIPGASWTPTHWMELPAAPQEPKP